ncbi:MAG: sugar ABC transporter permease [Pseudomonadota bacterium]
MKHRVFIRMILPSLAAMILFIALPIVSVFVQSLFVEHEQVLVVGENCGPFGCTPTTSVDFEATEQLRVEQPLGRFTGFDTYLGRNHLATSDVAAAWGSSEGIGDFISSLMNLRFYRALIFTLTFTAIVTPFTVVLGLATAVLVNALPQMVKGPTIFVTLLPMIVTPLIGSLVLFWMIDARGILGATLSELAGDPDLSLKASLPLTWLMLVFYGIWSSFPFAFVILYAGLQTMSQETLEASMLDGANRWQRLRYVVVPHLAPLVVFISLVQLMDNFRVFEPIVGFQAQANATSLSYIIYDDLRGGEIQLFGSAAATSMLTILGVAILVTPVVVRTWRDFKQRRRI